MDRLRKWLAPLLILLAACGIVGVYAWIASAKNGAVFDWIDLQGDRRALAGVTISGQLRDGYHSTHFALTDGVLSTEVELYDGPAPPLEQAFLPGKKKEFEPGHRFEARRSMFGGALDFDITYEDLSRLPKSITYQRALVRTDLQFHRNAYRRGNGNSEGYTFTNDVNYGIAQAAGRIYFTVPTTKHYTGTNGIYEITEFIERAVNQEDVPVARERVTFSLDKNQEFVEGDGSEGTMSGIEVLGLEGVADQLALLLVEDDMLIIRGYDAVSGEMVGEAIIDDFILTGRGAQDVYPHATAHHESYTAYSDHEAGVLNVYFSRVPEQPDAYRELLMFSIDFSNGAELVDEMVLQYARDEIDRIEGVFLHAYRNGKTYIVRTLRESAENSSTPFEIARPVRFIVDVYEAGRHLYQGELITDRNDDFIHVAYKPGPIGSISYDAAQYRNFDRIRVH